MLETKNFWKSIPQLSERMEKLDEVQQRMNESQAEIAKKLECLKGHDVRLVSRNGRSFAVISETPSHREERYRKMVLDANMEKWMDARLETIHAYKTPHLAEKSLSVLKQGKSLVFHGKEGTGKTLLAMCLIRKMWENKCSVRIIRWPNFMGKVYDCFTKNESVEDLIQDIIKADYLLLDEIAHSKKTEVKNYEAETFLRIINARYSQQKPFIATTNLSPSVLEKHEMFGSAAVSRLVDVTQSMTCSFENERNYRVG